MWKKEISSSACDKLNVSFVGTCIRNRANDRIDDIRIGIVVNCRTRKNQVKDECTNFSI
jgi:hypothetical protein